MIESFHLYSIRYMELKVVEEIDFKKMKQTTVKAPCHDSFPIEL